MNASSFRSLSSLLLAFSLAPSCALVLDLDAEGGEGGAGEGGRLDIDWTSAATGGHGGGSTAASTSSSASSSASGQPACEGYATFSGEQFFLIQQSPALDLDNELAIIARVKSAPDAASAGGSSYEGFVLSRLNPVLEKGYGLVLAEKNNDGAVYPEVRVYTRDSACSCAATTPLQPDTWVTLTAIFEKDKLGNEGDAGLWVDGAAACVVDCGDEKLEKFPASPVMGAALDRNSGFFRGAVADVSVVHWKDGAPRGDGSCGGATLFSLSFEAAPAQSFAADCPASLMVTLGSSNEIASDDPQVVACP
jgi:hypothetical protein